MRRAALSSLAVLSLAACGSDVAGPTGSLLSCVFDTPRALAVGEVVRAGGSGTSAVCLTASEPGTYAYIPFFAAARPDEEVVRLDVALSGAGFVTASPSALRWDGATAPGREPSFHDRLRRREMEELGPLILGAGGGPSAAPAARTALSVPAVGDLREFNVAISCDQETLRTGRVEYVSDHAVVVGDLANPVGLVAADYAHFGETFDTLVYPMGSEHFGTPSDIDENGRSILFFTSAVNALNPMGSEVVTVGFFWSGDLFPETATERLAACPGGNQAEMFYLMVPDPSGQAGHPVSVEQVRDSLSVWTIGHEYQHLINAGRRLHVNAAGTFEQPWLNEGLSHIAEELMFFRLSGLGPGTNIGYDDIAGDPRRVNAYNIYQRPNIANFTRYLRQPDTASLMGIDALTTRGASWAFLRYASDRAGGDDAAFFTDVVNSTVAGLDNLNEVLGGAALGWMQDWTVSVYADDYATGLAPEFVQTTWDFRSLYDGLFGSYPLTTLRLSPGETTNIRLQPGGAAFPIFSLEAGGRAAVHVEADGEAPPPYLRGSFVRVR